jgi:hypothetical protein
MNKYLVESNWTALLKKYPKIKDDTVRKALSGYSVPAESKYDVRIEFIGNVIKAAGDLKKAKDVAAVPELVKYLAEMVKAAEAEKKQIEADKKAAEAKAAADAKKTEDQAKKPTPKPTPKMLEEAYFSGWNDGLVGKNRSSLLAKVPELQKKYNEGHGIGADIAEKERKDGWKRPQAPTISQGTKDQIKDAKEAERRKKLRKEFVQYMNEWWGTVLPEDM